MNAAEEREARLDFKVAVLATDGGCIAGERPESPCDGFLAEAHHVITQQQLREHGLAAELWNPDNGASLCYRHHRRHHNRTEPIPQAFLPDRCIAFAKAHGLEYLLDRYYPREDT